jgi:hypothetical protein
MFKLTGTLKEDVTKDITKKDGTIVTRRFIYVEPLDSIFPIQVSINDQSLDLGNIGDEVTLDVSVYPFYFEDGKIRRAKINYYVK